MKFDKSILEGYAILTLKGEFDTFHCPRFQEEIESLLDQGISHIIVNMRLVRLINSTALGAVIKAHKRCRAEGGDLAIARPSSFVKKVVTQVGIDQLVPLFDDEEGAVKHMVKSLNALEFAEDAPVGQEKVLITFPDETRKQLLAGKSKKALVGTMSNADAQRVQFLWSAARHDFTQDQAEQLFFKGSEVRLKFQVKLFKRGYFDLLTEVADVQPVEDGEIRVTATYKKISDADREALAQFAEDMAFLKRQLPS